MKIKIVSPGGRIKSAAVGLDIFSHNGENFQTQMRNFRKNPPRELLEAFFPSDQNRLKQLLQGIGFYRPMLKTDQGMGGNFLPFYLDHNLEKTDLSVKTIVKEEGLAIPELYLDHNQDIIRELQKFFGKLNFRETHRILEPLLLQSREADKGRIPFFFIRPALLSSPIIFGNDILNKVTEKVEDLLGKVQTLASELCGQICNYGYLYFLADVFVTNVGEVVVEKLHFPDVGFFLTELSLDNSIVKETQKIVQEIKENVLVKMLQFIHSSRVYIITRDEVLGRQEDVLEILEIQSISNVLSEAGVQVHVKSISQVDQIPNKSTCLLLNTIEHKPILLERYRNGELVCYPNPYLQIASRQLTGLRESIVPSRFMPGFLELIGCSPKEDKNAEIVVKQIDNLLSRYDIKSDLLHVEINGETMPVHSQIHHSWRKVANRVTDPSNTVIKLRELPINSQNSLVTSSTGARLHSFRFTFTPSMNPNTLIKYSSLV